MDPAFELYSWILDALPAVETSVRIYLSSSNLESDNSGTAVVEVIGAKLFFANEQSLASREFVLLETRVILLPPGTEVLKPQGTRKSAGEGQSRRLRRRLDAHGISAAAIEQVRALLMALIGSNSEAELAKMRLMKIFVA